MTGVNPETSDPDRLRGISPLGLYGPTKAAINKSWKPGDIEKVK